MANNITVVGKIVTELKTNDANSFLSFRVLDKAFGKDAVDLFYDVKIFDSKLIERSKKYLKNGDPIMVSGALTSREYQSKTYLGIVCNSWNFVGGPVSQNSEKTEKVRPETSEDDIPF